MTNFSYFELIAFFYSGIFKHVKQDTDFDQANIRVYDDLWLFPEEQNYLNNLIVYINYMNVVYILRKRFTTKQIEVYKNQLKLVHENINIQELLSEDEYEHFIETLNQLNYEIENWGRENTIA
jgi:hypothetical protein